MKLLYMYLLQVFFILILFGKETYSQYSVPQNLLGNWESVNPENNRLQEIKFDTNNVFYFQSVLSGEYEYSLNGGKMIAKLLNSNKEIIDTSDIIIKQDTLISSIQKNGKKEITIMIKIPGENNSEGIAGNYTWKYPNGHTAFSKFTSDGKWIFRLPIWTTKCKFRATSDSLIIEDSNNSVQFMKYWLNDKLLIITDLQNGKETLYKKVDYFVK